MTKYKQENANWTVQPEDAAGGRTANADRICAV